MRDLIAIVSNMEMALVRLIVVGCWIEYLREKSMRWKTLVSLLVLVTLFLIGGECASPKTEQITIYRNKETKKCYMIEHTTKVVPVVDSKGRVTTTIQTTSNNVTVDCPANFDAYMEIK
jgi:hypothetical protein